MKKLLYTFLFLGVFFGCSKTDSTPDYSGTYSGSLAGTCVSTSGSIPLSQSENIIIVKSGSDYTLKNWETFDLKIILNTKGGNTFKVDSYNTSTSKNSLTGIFDSNNITINGTSQSLTSSTFCTYTYQGKKK